MAERKRLHGFLADMLKVGCVKGFKYFATHLRGREEMICSIINEPTVPILLSASNSPASSLSKGSQEPLPKESGSFMMSQKQQRRLSGYGFINVGLPPASPSDSEEDYDEEYTMFLVAGYARYSRPYVWIRSNHERLVQFSGNDKAEKDFPLQLRTTTDWMEGGVAVWDIVAELVRVCTVPCPPNPFAVDFDYFEALPLPERALASGAMVSFLQQLQTSGPHPYDRRVRMDLQRISRVHFHSMTELIVEGLLVLPPSPSEKLGMTDRPLKSPLRKPSYPLAPY